MSGLLTRIWIEVRWPVLWFCLGLASIMALLTRLLPKVLGNIHEMFSKMPMVKPLLTAMLGVDPGDKVSTELSQAFLWVHPTVLTLLWAHAVMYCTRVPAGEVDRGTADFLLCLPVTRAQIYLAETFGGIASGLLILMTGFVGHRRRPAAASRRRLWSARPPDAPASRAAQLSRHHQPGVSRRSAPHRRHWAAKRCPGGARSRARSAGGCARSA